MAGLTDSLKDLGARRFAWLAEPKYADPASYQQLAKPDTFAALGAAGIKHVVMDLPGMLKFSDDNLAEKMLTPEQLKAEIKDSPTYSVYKTYSGTPVKPEVLAQIMIEARKAGIQLHFTGNSSLSHLDGEEVQRSASADEFIGKKTAPTESFQGLAAKLGGGRAGLARARILGEHDKHLDDVASLVTSLPAGEKVLIVHQAGLPLERNLGTLLGEQNILRINTAKESASLDLNTRRFASAHTNFTP